MNGCAEGIIKMLKLRDVKRGWPHVLKEIQALGLLLSWYRTRGSLLALTMISGVKESVRSLFIRFARDIQPSILAMYKYTKVIIPSASESLIYQQAKSNKYPSIHMVSATTDGLKLYLEQAGLCHPNMIYNGWKSDRYITNVLVVLPAGHIITAIFNAPDFMHDSKAWGWRWLFAKMDRFYEETRIRTFVDSAFDKSHHAFLIMSDQYDTAVEGPVKIILNLQATSFRQAAERVMEMFQRSFPRMRDILIY